MKAGHAVFVFVVEGEGWFDAARDPFSREATGESWWDTTQPCVCAAETTVLYGPVSAVQVAIDRKPVRFLLVSGKPLHEPVAWYGPIVMNTREEPQARLRGVRAGHLREARRPPSGRVSGRDGTVDVTRP